MKHYVYCTGNKIVEVDAPAKTDYEKIINIAEKENDDIIAIEVVTKKWVSLFKQYNKLYKKCDELNLFDGDDLYRTINGYVFCRNFFVSNVTSVNVFHCFHLIHSADGLHLLIVLKLVWFNSNWQLCHFPFII